MPYSSLSIALLGSKADCTNDYYVIQSIITSNIWKCGATQTPHWEIPDGEALRFRLVLANPVARWFQRHELDGDVIRKGFQQPASPSWAGNGLDPFWRLSRRVCQIG